MRKVLLTGFEPFGGAALNPSWEVARGLDGAQIGGGAVVARLLPVVWGRAIAEIAAQITAVAPDLVVCLGESGRAEICPERVAINVSESASPDNAGCVLDGEPIAADGPAAYLSTLPVKEIVAAVQAAGVPCKLSNSAGTYLCNHVMYGTLHHLAVRGLKTPAGFIHVPRLPEQVAAAGKDGPSMALDTQLRGIAAAVERCLSFVVCGP